MGRIRCNDDVAWGWLIEYVGNALGRGQPSAFFDGTDLFYMALGLYACGHVMYAVVRIIVFGVRRIRQAAP